MTNAELIKASRICANQTCCDNCPRYDIDHTQDAQRCCIQLINDAADALEAAEKRIEELEAQMPMWTSVKNQLPEESGEYIVYIQMGTGVEVPDFFGSNDLSYVTSMYFKKGQNLWLDEYDESYNADLSLVDTVNDYHVTHWMPLPQKPKGERND